MVMRCIFRMSFKRIIGFCLSILLFNNSFCISFANYVDYPDSDYLKSDKLTKKLRAEEKPNSNSEDDEPSLVKDVLFPIVGGASAGLILGGMYLIFGHTCGNRLYKKVYFDLP